MSQTHLALAIICAAFLIHLEPTSAKPQTRSSQPIQQVEPFDTSITALPANYRHMDIEEIFNRMSLRSAKFVKAEPTFYETFIADVSLDALKKFGSQPGTVIYELPAVCEGYESTAGFLI